MDQHVKPSTSFAIFGKSSVGKSTIIHQLMSYYKTGKWNFDAYLLPTNGVNFSSFDMDINGKIFTVKAFDTAGGDEPSNIAPNLVRDIKGVIFVFDISVRDSLDALGKYIDAVKDIVQDKHYVKGEKGVQAKEKKVVYAVFANKIDLDRSVSQEEGEEFAQKYDALYFEVSAKTSDNLGYSFESFAKRLEPNENSNMLIAKKDNETNSCC